MRFKFLLFLIFASRILNAQCDYPVGVDTTLIISEARLMSDNWAYVELTNVGSTPIFLNEFKLGRLTQWSASSPIFDLCNDLWFMSGNEAYMFLPEVVLNPGESWVITAAYDFGPEYYKEHSGRLGGSERPKQLGMYDVADKLIHVQEPIGGETFPGDSVTTVDNDPEQTVKRGNYSSIFSSVSGGVFFLEQLYTATDSARVDQIGGFFDSGGGRNRSGAAYDVAGVYDGMRTSVLVRKNTIKEGNLDFANSVGLSLDDSDWIPIEMPAGYDQWRDIWWTIGNHGNFVLDENTLAPTLGGISVDYANKKITVPWGIRRLDEIMRNMEKKPGIAWNYVLNNVVEDSLYRSARTGDKLILYAVGNTLTTDTFDIVVTAPTADDNIVVPIDHRSSGNALTNNAQNGILSWPRVTKHESGTDTITGAGFGLEFDLRVDSLMKYLEKPANAAWEIVWIDGVERADLKNGDILKVTSESGNAKEYFIQIQTYRPSSNANLAAITWPDIPDRYHGFAGWTGDTIPNFSPGTRNYRLKVPFDVKDVPALFATKQDYNAKVKTTRARSINGNIEDRTVIFEVTAEDDSTSIVYTVELIKEKHPDNVEPYTADPFISEFVNSYTINAYVELYNPGNQPIDLRNYAMGMANQTDNYRPIKHNQAWVYRWMVYVPGTKYVDEATWEVTPKMLLPDPNVNPILRGGETFVMALINRDADYYPPYNVNFRHGYPGHPNPWNEDMKSSSTRGAPMPPNGNRNNSFYLYKILNDSVKLGLKPVGDVNDFENIDTWGMPDGGSWIVGDYVLARNEGGNIFKRKPEIIKGNPERGGSFGLDNPDNSEWIRIDPGVDYATVPSSQRQAAALGGVGSHFMDPITFYKSTVSSLFYKISAGFGHDEEILGVVTGTTVSEFINNIYKEDEDQTLEIRSGADTIAVLEQNAVISPNDVLVVLSADSTNTTYYRLDVTDEGLNSNAVLTSSRYTIEISVSPNVDQDVVGEASISRLEYGSTLKNIMQNINVPQGATVTIINDKGDYIPFKRLNYDTLYVFKTVSPEISLDVVAEDGKTRIVYNLVPTSKEDDAFILSDVYLVSQINNLIEYVPLGITFSEFVNNVTPSYNSSLKLVDKMGMERTTGEIKADDKVVVTSANGEVSNSYYISLLFPGNTKTYLAYVVSEAYSVNQVDYIISGTVESTLTNAITVAEFMQQVIPSIGATIVIIDAEENEKTSGNLAEGDRVKVTSGDGALVAYYDIILTGTSSRMPTLANLEIYPNPTSGLLNINGLDAGNRVQIYNNQGKLMRQFEAHNYHETITLESLPDGLFLIVISDKNQILGQFKAMKK